MRPATLAVLGVTAYAVFLVALVPASFVASRIDGATRGGLHLHEASGSAWHGRARAIVATPAGPLALDELQWRLRPSALLAGRIEFAARGRSPGFDANARVGRSPGAWQVRDLSASGTASSIASFLPLVAAWRPEGAIAVTASEIAWNDSSVQGSATIEWRNAALALSDVRPLGSYRAEVTGEGAAARLRLTTLQGPLTLAGQGNFAPPARVTFSGDARAEAASAAALEGLLNLIGPQRADGTRAIEWRSH